MTVAAATVDSTVVVTVEVTMTCKDICVELNAESTNVGIGKGAWIGPATASGMDCPSISPIRGPNRPVGLCLGGSVDIVSPPPPPRRGPRGPKIPEGFSLVGLGAGGDEGDEATMASR